MSIKLSKKVLLSALVATITLSVFVVPVSAASKLNGTMLATKIDVPEAGSSATPTPDTTLESTAEAEVASSSSSAFVIIELKDKVSKFILEFTTWATTPMATELASERLESTPAATITDVLSPTPTPTPTK